MNFKLLFVYLNSWIKLLNIGIEYFNIKVLGQYLLRNPSRMLDHLWTFDIELLILFVVHPGCMMHTHHT